MPALSRAGRLTRHISYREPSTSDDDLHPDPVDQASAHHDDDHTHVRKRRRTHHSHSQQSQRPARSRNAVSYKDPSDDDSLDDEPHQSPPLESPPRRNRNHGLLSASPEITTKLRRLPSKSYQLPSSDAERHGDSAHNESGPRPRRTGRLRRTRSLQASAELRRESAPLVTETPSDDDSDDGNSDGSRPRKRRARRRQGPRRNTRSFAKKMASRSRSNAGSTKQSTPPNQAAVLETDGFVPPWATLPYQILLDIFSFASTPLHDDDFNPTSNISWLIGVARVCKDFAEPALTALYRCPPLIRVDKPHRLLSLLSDPSTSKFINYNVKIRRLEFDAPEILAYSWTGRGQFELGDLIPHVPKLTELAIVHPQARPPFRPMPNSGRWHYSAELFKALGESALRLKSWTWNSTFRTRDQTLFWMGQIHQMESFQRLEHISLQQFDKENVEDGNDAANQRSGKQVLADNLALVPGLKSLAFESCPVIDGELLPLLKDSLQHLTTVNCHNITSEILRDFLVSRGGQLLSLVLNHNQALDISFLPDLKRACPRLQVLKMDLNYFDSHATFRDSDPKYDELLKEEEIPSWPSTLQTIEMVHLRKWGSGAAETFFSSLIDSAEQLPDLRRLVLKATLDIGWRDRAGFRDLWIGRLQKVFQRISPPPNPHLMSSKRFRMLKELPPTLTPDDSPQKLEKAMTFNHMQVTPKDDQEPSRRRLLRPHRAAAGSFMESDSEENPDDDGDVFMMAATPSPQPPAKKNIVEEKFIQGMCEVVDIRIDNLRPREEQFNENDFLDSEASGDEDWNGDDNILPEDDDNYAW
ncbi:uncharacterized protein J3D65DRAFT_570733 [Phyllosticta citribraziliensis]|uniref:F-box domain-containing protein n=1 Tax=Phyllosticta citribraziliensis TaxID=989973 RepID=A0ABR1LUL0_9PEZI